MLNVVKSLNSHRPKFLEWIDKNKGLVELIAKELEICALFYIVNYSKYKNSVVICQFELATKHEANYGTVPQMVYKEFHSFYDFKMYFYSLFSEYEISQDELDRIILENNYKCYFDLILTKEEFESRLEKHSFTFFFDYGGVCLFDKVAVNHALLPISTGLINELNTLCREYDSRINWNCLNSSIPWTQKQEDDFKFRAIALYERLKIELGSDYEIIRGD